MLKVADLHVYYGNVHALKGISLEVRQGEVVTLIGANGAGKSSLLKAISGLVRPKNGSITYEGEELTRLASDKIVSRGIAHVPEGRRIFTNLSVMENLMVGAYQRKDKRQLKLDYEEVFTLFPILHARAEQMAGTLSGGEQQMLALSRAILSKPKLVILDEPSLGLAPVMVDTVFDVIDKIRKNGITILLVEQNAHLALEASERAYVLETGEIKISGSSRALLQDNKVVEAYLG
ncbi:branched-chain amino acid ABC transporter ATP-binding protein [Brevibacillus choshinensis]|uniref:Branched-chain amino acid ABC transporter ATP-binding protein n=1 Tax=Brevibacillus choshinensis TaxID=54911 RepID=A0ABR5NDX9_BRECH|nr:ABC transporter ATP-binding protein [Brevibacillus choshinensis]KQL49762.1 branched-chain amino acid ABC transporter ATP-binding protein [Brevibacillus choshinensis]